MTTKTHRPEQQAINTLKELGAHRIPVPVELVAEGLGLICKSADLDNDVSGLLVYEAGNGKIAYNRSHPVVRQRFTIAHEIGHFILHAEKKRTSRLFVDKWIAFRKEGQVTGAQEREEIEANAFAAALLMPADLLKQEIEKIGAEDDDCVNQLARSFGVSTMAMSFRLINLGLFAAVQG